MDTGTKNYRDWLREKLHQLELKEEFYELTPSEKRDLELYNMWLKELDNGEE